MRHGCRHLWLLLVLLAAHASSAQAESVYRWTDSEGRLHYGDRPPPSDAEQAEQLRMPSFAPPSPPVEEDPYSILNQVERLETSRRNLVRERREKQREDREYKLRMRELEARRAASQYPVVGPRYAVPGPVYPVPPVHRPGLPGYRPRPPGIWEPDHPAYRPPMHPHPPVAVPYPGRGGAVVVAPR